MPEIAAKKTEDGGQRSEDGGQRSEDGGQKTEDGGQKPVGEAPGGETPKDQPKGEGVEAGAGELKSCDLRPTAEEMFGRFVVSVAGRPLAVHQPVNEIGDTAERLTAEWLARKDKFAAK